MKYLRNEAYAQVKDFNKFFRENRNAVTTLARRQARCQNISDSDRELLMTMARRLSNISKAHPSQVAIAPMLEAIKKIPHVSNVEFTCDRVGYYHLEFDVHNIIIRSKDCSKAARMPPSHFQITPECVFNEPLAGEYIIPDWYGCHPHSTSNQHLCFGNIENEMIALKRSLQLDLYVAMLMSFLEEVNIADTAGRSFKNRFLVGDPSIRLFSTTEDRVFSRYNKTGYKRLWTLRWSPEYSRWGMIRTRSTASPNVRFYVAPYEYVVVPKSSLTTENYTQNSSGEWQLCPSLSSPMPDIKDIVTLDSRMYKAYGARTDRLLYKK